MNKYSSKAIKTAATVGMSLAMVLSNAAPVLAAGSVADACLIATEDQLNSVKKFIAHTTDLKVDWKEVTADSTIKVDYQFAKKAYKYDTSTRKLSGYDTTSEKTVLNKPYPATIEVNGATLKLFTVNSNVLTGGTLQTTEFKGDDNTYYYYATASDPATIIGTVKVNLIDYIKGDDSNIVVSGTEIDGETPATAASGEGKAIMYSGPANAFKTNLEQVAKGCDATTTTAVKNILGVYNAVIKTGNELVELAEDGETAVYDKIANIEAFLEKYAGNLTSAQKDTLNEKLETLYADESIDSSSNSYQAALTKFLDKATTDLEDELTNADYTNPSKSAAITTDTIDTWVKEIKKNASYKRFKNEDAVIEFLESVEALKDDAKEVEEAVNKTKNEAYKAYVKGTKSAQKAVNEITFTEAAGVGTIGLTIDQYNLLKDFKEDVVDKVLTMETKKVGNRYVDKSTKSAFVSGTQFTKVMNDFGKLEEYADAEEGKFVWDIVSEHMEKVIKNLNTLEKDLPTLDAVTLQASDRDIIVAADDAVYFLQDKGKDNLTSAQTRTVRDAERKVSELLEAYRIKFGSINSTVNGWVNKGDGNWSYYENGNAVTKWVASGSDWYYVKGGVMLRNSWIASDAQGSKWYYVDDAGKMVSNTTVNGYTFNSYGVWVK